MTINLLSILDKFYVIKLLGVIVNNDQNLIKSIKIRKILYNKKIPLAISNNNNSSNEYIKNNIDIWEGCDLINDLLKDNYAHVICHGDITSIYKTLVNNKNLTNKILSFNYINDRKTGKYVNIPNIYNFENQYNMAKIVFKNLDYINVKINVLCRNYCSLITNYDIDFDSSNYFIYKPLSIVFLLRPDLFNHNNYYNISIIDFSKIDRIKLKYIIRYINYWLK